MSSPLVDRVRRYVRHHALWTPGARVVAALSGGADSVALLLLLRDLANTGEVVLAGAAHLHHGLRPEADDDADFCRRLCAALDVPFVVERVSVLDQASSSRRSIEATARDLRYAFLERAREHTGADHVAVAHTRDDQAETVLLRLLRGTGTRGLRAILAVRGRVVRPLLGVARSDLRSFLDVRGQAWREDATNSDRRILRNRIRHELLPLLETYRPAVTQVLARTAEIASGDEAYLDALARGVTSRITRADRGAVSVSLPALRVLPVALQRRVAHRALERAGCVRAPRAADVERLLVLFGSTRARPVVIAGVAVERFPENAVLSIRGRGACPALPIREVRMGQSVSLSELGPEWRFRASEPIQRRELPTPGSAMVVVAADAVQWPLRVRGRLPGDRMHPKGLGGSKKLQDLFVDRKVPRGARDQVPVVADATGRIVWVVGHAVAEGLDASTAESDVVVLSVERPVRAPEAS